jgi:AcrR family transcriptional regulator
MAIDATKTQRILDAATSRFARFGFKKTSIDEIAKDAGVGKGTVYLVAQSKEDLFYQAVHRELRGWVAEVSPVVDPRVPADQLLLTVTATAWAYLANRPLVRDLMLANHDEMLPLWSKQLGDLRGICRQNTEEVLRIGIRQGVFRADIDVEVAGRVLQDLFIAGMIFSYKTEKPEDQQMIDSALCLDLLLRGLKQRG